MGAGLEGLEDRERTGPARRSRWAEERKELISDNNGMMMNGRGEQQQQQAGIASSAASVEESLSQKRPSRAESRPSRINPTPRSSSATRRSSSATTGDKSSGSVEGRIHEWENNANASRNLILYTAEGSQSVMMMGEGASSGRGKSPRLTRVRSSQSTTPEEQENPAQERYSRRRPKSPRKSAKVDLQPSAPPLPPEEEEIVPPKLSQSHLRQPNVKTSPTSPPRRTRVEEDELQDVLAEIIHDQSLTLARAARRQQSKGRSSPGNNNNRDVVHQEPPTPPSGSASEVPQSGSVSPRALVAGGASLRPPPGSSTGESLEESPVRGGQGGRRTKTRRQKRKADAVHDVFPPEHPAVIEEHRAIGGFHPLQGLQQFVSRATTRTEPSSPPSTWMQLFSDVIMWRDVPRSTLLFGAGCFCILSASFIRDVRCGALTFTAYIALVYLGAVFLHRNFLRGGSSQHEEKNWELGESEALEILRVFLPAINLLLKKSGQLFCGDPSTTLKVASILWLLAQVGYFMTLWSFARFAFVLMFVIPKLYSCYSHQLHGQADAYVDRLRKAWTAYSHKKAAIFGSLVLAWNLSSATSRLYGAFLLLVTIKLYTHHLADQTSDPMETEQALPVSEQAEERLMTPPRIH